MKHLYVFITVSALLLSACEEERLPAESWADGTGGLRLEQPEMQSETDIPIIVTRSGFELEPGSFPIRIEQEDGNGSYSTYTSFVSYNAMLDSGMPLVLPVGDYRVVATSYEASAAGSGVSETPYFEGSQEPPSPSSSARSRASGWSCNCRSSSGTCWRRNRLTTNIR